MEPDLHTAQLERWRVAFEAGDSLSLLLAIRMCIELGLRAPAWAASAFSKAVMGVAASSVTSWDDAFGPPRHAATSSRAEATAVTAWMRVEALRKAQPSPRDPFAAAADEFGVSRAELKRLYREGARLVDAAIEDAARPAR